MELAEDKLLLTLQFIKIIFLFVTILINIFSFKCLPLKL